MKILNRSATNIGFNFGLKPNDMSIELVHKNIKRMNRALLDEDYTRINNRRVIQGKFIIVNLVITRQLYTINTFS